VSRNRNLDLPTTFSAHDLEVPMPRLRALGAAASVAALLAAPAFAQRPGPNAPTASPAVSPPSSPAAPATASPPSTATSHPVGGTLQKSHGSWRSSKLVGATVYNDRGDSIGTIDDLLVGDDGRVSGAVISVGGFLGLGSKLVEVPFSQLRFEQSRTTTPAVSTAAGAGPTAAAGATPADVGRAPSGTAAGGQPAGTAVPATADTATAPGANAANAASPAFHSVVAPGATQESLTAMPEFKYDG
jgi:sporulation protein YlmC with PRC-barrel domain